MGDKITTEELKKIKPEHVVAAIQSFRNDVKNWKEYKKGNYFVYYKDEFYPSREIMRRAYEELFPDRKVISDFLHGRGGIGKGHIADALQEKGFVIKTKSEMFKELKEQEVSADFIFIDDVNKVNTPTDYVEYIPRPEKRLEPLQSQGRIVYIRRKEISINALKRAGHLCEVDNRHPGFIRKSDGTNYTEPHHLIPMCMQRFFENSLDVEANIVSLCSNCHNLLHYGKDKVEILKQLYDLRKNELKEAGIEISFDDLLDMYA